MAVESPVRRSTSIFRSSVVLHAVMAVGGSIMVLYLLAHMYGNLKVFSGPESFDGYAAYLRTVGEPLLPHSGVLWIIRIVLLPLLAMGGLAAVLVVAGLLLLRRRDLAAG